MWRTRFPQRQQLAVMPNQRRVGTVRKRALAREKLLGQNREVDRVEDTRIERLVGLIFFLPRRRADPAVAITRLALKALFCKKRPGRCPLFTANGNLIGERAIQAFS